MKVFCWAILIAIVLFVFAAASAFALGELLLFTPEDEGADAEWASEAQQKRWPDPDAGGHPKGQTK